MSDIPQAPERDLPPGRQHARKEHLLREIRPRQEEARRRPWLRPAVLTPVAAAALSVAVVVGLAVTRDGGRLEQAPVPASSASEKPAGEFLRSLSRFSATQKPYAVKDSAWIYTELKEYHWKMDPARRVAGCAATDESSPYGDQAWWESVDGRSQSIAQDAGSAPSTANDRAAGSGLPLSFRATQQLPTDADGMYRWLTGASGGGTGSERDGFDKAARLLDAELLVPKVEGAVYAALARFDGVTLVDTVHDVAGRPGVGVAMGTSGGDREVLVFDKADRRFLGESLLDGSPRKDACDATGVGDALRGTAILERAVVDHSGDTP
ncbi:CU044_5270 family protein [Streptomyces sp. NPDC050085]|uniref:CU044_5270 family protein n=1 Tax=Streptomyces sp. NPDC050085 TaxID=3365600 RepID=UPI0037A3770B